MRVVWAWAAVYGLVACGEPKVAAEGADDSVAQMVARRDGVDTAIARARVRAVRRVADAARAAPETGDGGVVNASRQRLLRRAARARIWSRVFEDNHRAPNIPDDDPMLVQALASAKHVRPELHVVCQLVALPDGAPADDVLWQARAQQQLEHIGARIRRYVDPEDPQACRLLARLVRFGASAGDVQVKVESGAFDLQACATRGPDGACTEPRFAPEWTNQVAAVHPPAFTPVFRTRFGSHLVLVREHLEALSWDVDRVRGEIVDRWRTDKFQVERQRLLQLHTVRIPRLARRENDG